MNVTDTPPEYRLRAPNKKTEPIPPGAVYCDRPSPFENPFVISHDGNRSEVITKYKAWLMAQPSLITQLPRRKDVIWCAGIHHCCVIATF